jgi:hypothetical protein
MSKILESKTLIVIVYDGIDNAVFNSQVLAPMNAWHQKHSDHQLVLISFEKELPAANHPIFSTWPGPIHILKKFRFFGRPSLYAVRSQLQKILALYPCHEIRARGPHAGWLAVHTARPEHCQKIVIQARGLLAEEYLYVHKNGKNPLMRLIHTIRSRWYNNLERAAYQAQSKIPYAIESVSPALRDYLITHWAANPSIITIAEQDKPAALSLESRVQWRTKVRAQFNIPQDAIVYCYSGSAKSWQCPDLVVELFAQKLKAGEKNIFLLILTQEPQPFEQQIKKLEIPTHLVHITSVPANQVIHHCAAGDIGILLREKSPVNWVSRPTKALEYQAAGLTILHNDTVAWLTEDSSS